MQTGADPASHKLQISYQLLFERNPLPMWVYDVQTLRMLAVNEAALAQYGYSKQEFVGLTLLDLCRSEKDDSLTPKPKPGNGTAAAPTRCQHQHRNGEVIEVETLTEELVFDGLHARLVRVKDVTAAQHLHEERETLAAVIRSTDSAIISTDRDGRVKLFNPAAERIFGRSQESMQGQSIDVLLPARFRAAHTQHLGDFADSHTPMRMMGMGRVKGLRANGQEIDLDAKISQVMVNQQPILIANLRDVTAQLRVHAEFELSRIQLSELTSKLMTQEKTLVKRLAQTLHDQLGQTLAAIRMAHETVLTLHKVKPPPAIERMQAQMSKLIGHAIRQVRQVLVDLRPPLLDEQGLAAALDNELRNRAHTLPQMDISIHVPPEVASVRWPTEVEYAAFMVAREAVENAFRHSGASAVSVWVAGSPQALQLKVVDNGVGISPDTMLRTGHLGIIGMQERSQLVGATVEVGPGEVQGTCVRFQWESPQ